MYLILCSNINLKKFSEKKQSAKLTLFHEHAQTNQLNNDKAIYQNLIKSSSTSNTKPQIFSFP